MKPNLLKEMQNKLGPMVRHMDETYEKYERLELGIRGLLKDIVASQRICQHMYAWSVVAAAASGTFFILTIIFS